MQSDRELLEAAAKAAGVALLWTDEDRPCIAVPFKGYVNYDDWNPLAYDGDALRLAVKLRIQITPGTYNNDEFTAFKAAGGEAHEFRHYQQDEFAATRRAIVRAAAAMAKE